MDSDCSSAGAGPHRPMVASRCRSSTQRQEDAPQFTEDAPRFTFQKRRAVFADQARLSSATGTPSPSHMTEHTHTLMSLSYWVRGLFRPLVPSATGQRWRLQPHGTNQGCRNSFDIRLMH
eukprot:scaffold3574_cov121-Isochrysis_galbana.AAC.13